MLLDGCSVISASTDRRSGPFSSAVVGEGRAGNGGAAMLDVHAAAFIRRVVVDHAVLQDQVGAFVAHPNGATYWTVIIHELALLAVGRATVADAQRAAALFSPIVFHTHVCQVRLS